MQASISTLPLLTDFNDVTREGYLVGEVRFGGVVPGLGSVVMASDGQGNQIRCQVLRCRRNVFLLQPDWRSFQGTTTVEMQASEWVVR